MYKRKREKAGMMRAAEIIEAKKLEREQKIAARKERMAQKAAEQAAEAAAQKAWYKFW